SLTRSQNGVPSMAVDGNEHASYSPRGTWTAQNRPCAPGQRPVENEAHTVPPKNPAGLDVSPCTAFSNNTLKVGNEPSAAKARTTSLSQASRAITRSLVFIGSSLLLARKTPRTKPQTGSFGPTQQSVISNSTRSSRLCGHFTKSFYR